MRETNPFWTRLVKPIRDEKINSIINNLEINKVTPWDKDFTFAERLYPKQKLINDFKNWIGNYVTGLHSFPEQYVCNGNTDSLNHLFMERKFNRVCTLDNEYSYYGYLCHTLGISRSFFTENTINEITTNDLVCISYPNAHDGSVGNRQRIIEELQSRNIPLYIDMAYCGLTSPFKLNLRSTENTFFAFSFSKTLALSFNRIGLLFAGRSVPGLEIMNKIGYINLSGVHIVNNLMNEIPCDYIYTKYKDQYESLCKQNDVKPVDCILYGHDQQGQKYSLSEFYQL